MPQARRSVLAARVAEPITPVIADHLRDGVEAAEWEGHQAFLVELDTSGGLDTSMREIVQSFLGARVPVGVYVRPSGARAASAGALITFSAHVAATAPGTTIGAATPVDLQGGEISDKVINDAAAFAETVAAQRGRNTEFAVQTVREGRSVPAEEAERIGAVDLLADDRAALPTALDAGASSSASTMAEVSAERNSTLIFPLPMEILRLVDTLRGVDGAAAPKARSPA